MRLRSLASGKAERKWGDVRIGRRWSGVVRKAEPIPVGSSPFIQ